MTPPRILLVLLAAGAAAACGGKEEAKPAPGPGTEKPAAKPAEPAGGGLDLASLQRKAEELRAANPAAGPAAAPGAGPADPAPAEKGTTERPPAEEAPAQEEKAPAPSSPDEITDTEVLLTWSADEREALQEMPEGERRKEIHKRRLEMFKERGGVLDATSGKMEDRPPDAVTGERGPARPEAKAERELPPPELKEILLDIESEDAEIRARGIEAAKRYPDAAVASRHIVPLLADPDAELRAIAASTLGALKQGDAVSPLAKLIEKGDKDPVRAMAIMALFEIGGKEAKAVLRGVARDGEEPSDRAAALGMLVKLKEVGEVKDLLKAAMGDISAEVRQQAVAAVREFNLKEFEKDLLPLLSDFSEQVILEAMRALGSLGTREAVAPLMKILLKPDPEADDPEMLRSVANDALEKITGVDQGFDGTLPDDKIAAAVDSWRVWWQKNRDKWR